MHESITITTTLAASPKQLTKMNVLR